MKIYVEESIVDRANRALERVRNNWNLITLAPTYIVKDFTQLPYWVCDYVDHCGNRWKIPMSLDPGVMFIIDYVTHVQMIIRYAGGTIGDYSKEILDDKITIVVFPNDTIEALELRIVHELLHAMELPADDCQLYLKQFLPWYLRIWYRNDCNNPKVQRRFYKYLLECFS